MTADSITASDDLPDILLVEDNSLHVRLVTSMLSDIWPDPKVRVARSLKSAIREVEEESPDCILLDLLLGDADGIEAVNALLAVDSSVPIVVLSSHEDDDTALQTVKEGAQDYLVKGTVGPHALARAIRFSIQRHRMDRRALASRSINMVPAASAVLDADGAVLYAHAELCEMLGRSYEELVGESVDNLTHPNDLASWSDVLGSDLGEKQELTVRLRHGSGNDLPVRIELSPLMGYTGSEPTRAYVARYHLLAEEGTASSGGTYAMVSGLVADN